MRQPHSDIIFNVLRYHFPQASNYKLVKLAEKLQRELGMNDPRVQVSPARDRERIIPTTLLFADDNVTLVETTTRYMGEIRPEWRFLLAHSLAEARRIYNQYSPDAAVLDVDLPDGNGLDLLSEIKRNRPKLPIVIISGDDREALRQEVIDRGGYSFLTKPFSAPALVNHIELAIGSSRDASSVSVFSKPEASGVWTNPHALALRPLNQKLAVYDPDVARSKRFVLK
jgi:DNA-binding NtrC family response regulator